MPPCKYSLSPQSSSTWASPIRRQSKRSISYWRRAQNQPRATWADFRMANSGSSFCLSNMLAYPALPSLNARSRKNSNRPRMDAARGGEAHTPITQVTEMNVRRVKNCWNCPEETVFSALDHPYLFMLIKSYILCPAQDIHPFVTCSHLNALQSCALIFSTNFQFIFTFK